MSDERQQMRTTLAWAAGITGWVLFIVATVVVFAVRRSSQREIATEKQTVEEKTRALKWSDGQLARFVAMAREQVPNAPADVQLDQLHERITAVIVTGKKLQGRRYIGAAGIERIKDKLQNAPAFDVEIGAVLGDADSLALAEELRATFEAAGFKVRKVAQYPAPPIPLPGVSIYSKSQFDEVLGSAIGQVFEEISQQPIQWIGKDLLGTPKPGDPEPDIKIIVGPK